MPKQAEKDYYKNIGADGIAFSANKPFSDRVSAGSLLNSIAAIYSILNNEFGEDTLRIIDLGCGTGWSSNLFSLSGHKVLGVDLSKDAIREANKRFKNSNLTFKSVNYEALTKLGTFDVAIFIDSLHHADDETKVLKSVNSILREGGICIVCEPGKGHSTSEDALEAVRLYGVNERDMPPALVKKAAKNADFSRIKIYSHPSQVQKAFYKEFKGGFKAKTLNSYFGRLLAQGFVASFGKTKEALVVLYK